MLAIISLKRMRPSNSSKKVSVRNTQVAIVDSSCHLKFQQGDMCIKTHYTRRSGILPDPKPQRGDMFIEYQLPNSPKAPAGRHVCSKFGYF